MDLEISNVPDEVYVLKPTTLYNGTPRDYDFSRLKPALAPAASVQLSADGNAVFLNVSREEIAFVNGNSRTVRFDGASGHEMHIDEWLSPPERLISCEKPHIYATSRKCTFGLIKYEWIRVGKKSQVSPIIFGSGSCDLT